MSAAETFERHRGPVTCAVAVPWAGSGLRTIVSAGYDGAVGITDVEQRRMELLGYHEHLVNRIAVSASGRLAASCSSDYTIGLWDLERRERVGALRGHSDDVEDFTFVDETTGVSVSRDRRVIVWDLATGSIRSTLAGHERDVLSVAQADGHVFTSGDDMTLRVWDLATGELLRCWGPFEHETDTCAIDPRRDRAILGCDDGAVRVFEVTSGRLVAELQGHSSGIKVVAVSPATGDIFSAAYDRRLQVWDADSLTARIALEPLATAWERSFTWTPEGTGIVAGTFDGTVAAWDVASGRRLFEIGDGDGNACMNEVAGIGDRVAAVADDGYVRLGRLTREDAGWTERRRPRAGRVLANAVAADADAGIVAVGSHDQALRIFALEDDTLRETAAVELGCGPINSIRVVGDRENRHLLVACYSGDVVVATADGEPIARHRVHDGAVKAVRAVPERDLGLSCSADGSVFAWSLETGERRMAFPAHTAIVNDIDVEPTGRRLATVGRDFVLNVFGLDDGRLLQAFPLNRRSPKAVAFVDEATIVVGDYWGHAIRQPLNGEAKLERRVAANGISSLARRDDGLLLASSYDGRVLLLDPATLDVLNELRAMTQRLAARADDADRVPA